MSGFTAELGGRDPAWLAGQGPDADVAVFTRARLARNLAGVSFPHHAADGALGALLNDLRERAHGMPSFATGTALDFGALSTVQREALHEKMLAPQTLLGEPRQRGLVLSPDLGAAALLNVEDHVRLAAFQAGFDPLSVLARVMTLDNELEREVEPAFDAEWGYLTASPTNLGTGLQLSAVLHLPGLVLVGEIERVLNALRQLQFAVCGLYGQGNAVRGGLFRISNLVSLGRDEAEIAEDFRVHVGKIITYERSARDQLYGRDHLGLEDLVQRSRAVLANARLITAQEAFDCLSNVRLGEALGLLPVSRPGRLNLLTVHQQSAHLQLGAGRALSVREKGAARAALLREYFAAAQA